MSASKLEVQGQLWLNAGEHSLGGPGRMELLARIAELGSISQAAKAIKMSYKAAWDAIDNMNNLAGEALVVRVAGGKGGGYTELTERGKKLLNNYQKITHIHQQFLALLNQEGDAVVDDFSLLKRFNMKTSARNQFSGKVAKVVTGAVNNEIIIDLAGGQKLVASITMESSQELGIVVGKEVVALVKSSSIILASDLNGMKLSTRNQFTGTVQRIQKGAVNTEVVLDAGGMALAAIITNDSAERLALKEGSEATALFKAGSVIVGVIS